MNKYQEALDRLVKHSCPQRTSCNECDMKGYCNRIAKDWIDVLQELVDKATPAKVIYEADGYDEKGNLIFDTAYCPNCDKDFEVDYDEHSKYCPNCGQAIDWSEE